MLEFGQDGVSGTRHSTKFTSPNPSKSQKLFTKVSSHLILPPSKRLNRGMRPRPQHTNWFGGSVHRTCNEIFHHVLIHACVSVLPFLPACPCPLNYNIEKHKKTYQSNVFIIIIVLEKNGAQIQIFVIHGRISKPHVLDYFLLLLPLAQMPYMTSIMAVPCVTTTHYIYYKK